MTRRRGKLGILSIAAGVALIVLALVVEVGAMLGVRLGERPSASVFANRAPPPIAGTHVRVCFVADVQRGLASVVRPLVAELARAQTDLLVSSGDLVSHGEAPYYGLVSRALDRAGSTTPLLVVPGNHEVQPDRVKDYANGRRLFEEKIGPRWWSVRAGAVQIIGLDNGVEPIENEQLEWLRATLAAAPLIPYLVVCHRPPRDLDAPGSPPITGATFVALLETRPPIAVIAGHTHADRDATVSGVRYIYNAQGGDLGKDDPGFGPTRFNVIMADVDADGSVALRTQSIARGSSLAVTFDYFCVRMWIERRAHAWLVRLVAMLGVACLMPSALGLQSRLRTQSIRHEDVKQPL